MAGYLPDTATADAFVDGWYRTGDVGWIEPEGWVHLTDRCKEMIKVSGFQVAPAEIEACCTGTRPLSTARCSAWPTSRRARSRLPPCRWSPGDGRTRRTPAQLVADSLATYKHLRRVVLVDAIPRTPSGKVLRRELRDDVGPEPVLGRPGSLNGRSPLP